MKLLSTLILIFAFSFQLTAQNLYFPPLIGNNWDTVSPQSLGWCSPELDTLYDFLDQEETRAFIILKDGKIVVEKYFHNFTQDSNWVWFSAGKSLMATLVGIAQSEGDLNINDKTSDYLGQGWTSMNTSKEDLIKIHHQLTMNTGLDDAIDFACTDDTCLQYLTDAGSRWFYHNAPYSLLRDVLENATGKNINNYVLSKIKLKTGMNGFWLGVGYNNFYFSTARSMARFGLMTLNKGKWNNTTVLADTTYYNQMVNSSQALNPSYGYLWWLNGQNSYIPPGIATSFNGSISPDAPSDLILAAGAQGQFCAVVPSMNLVMIRMGSASNPNLVPTAFHNDIWKQLNEVFCTTTSDNEIKSFSAIRLFPNPVIDQMTLELDSPSSFLSKIYTMSGQLIHSSINQKSFDVSDYAAGMYFIQVEQNGKIQALKFVKY